MADRNQPRKPAASPEELRRMATGGKVPPPASLPPGMRGAPPLPLGKPVQVSGGVGRQVSLTEIEKGVMRRVGWKDGDPVPENMAAIIAKYRSELGDVESEAARDAVDLPLPIDPRTPPLKVETVDIKSLSPQHRQAIQSDIKAALEAEARAREEAKAQARVARLPGQVQQALASAGTAAMSRQKPPARTPAKPAPPPVQPTATTIDLDDDLAVYDALLDRPPAASPAPRPVAKPAAPAQPSRPAGLPDIDLGGRPATRSAPEQMEDQLRRMMAEDGIAAEPDHPLTEDMPVAEPEAPPVEEDPPPPPEDEPADLGAAGPPPECPHCGWQMDRPDIPEPDHGEKMAFLHAVLGQRSFTKEYELFGGAVKVVFRTLTTPEMDSVFGTAFQEKQQGLLVTQMDFWERINRLRLSLQLASVRSDTFQHDLPDGLSPDTNPKASRCWSEFKMPEPSHPGDKGLAHVEKWLTANVLTSEIVNRVVAAASSRFGRLVAKMEAMVDNPDFWQATGEPR